LRRAYKFRAYPTRPQEGRSARLLRDHCGLYNAALEERREAWRMSRTSMTYNAQSAQLREIRRADPDGQGRHSFTAQQQTLRRLNAVFCAFYKRSTVRGGSKPGYPRFKPHQRFNQVLFVAGDGAKWSDAAGNQWARATFQGVGSMKVKQHRAVRGTVKTLQLKREHRRWYVIVVAEAEPAPLPAANRKVGIDVGIARFATTSDGEVVANPRFLATSASTIADLHRRKARAKCGSGNQRRTRQALAKQWRKVRDRRRGMTRRPAPVPDPGLPGAYLPNQAAAKAGLNKAILDAGWAQFISILTGKAEEAGRKVILVNPAGTSITCHQCGRRCRRPRQDIVICPGCGPMDADINGARNIAARAGLGSGQAAA
jgi:putative transposase